MHQQPAYEVFVTGSSGLKFINLLCHCNTCGLCDPVTTCSSFITFSLIHLVLHRCYDVLQIPSGLPRHLEAAVQRYGSTTYKATCVTVLDQNGKLTSTLLYGKYPTVETRLFCLRLFILLSFKAGYVVCTSLVCVIH